MPSFASHASGNLRPMVSTLPKGPPPPRKLRPPRYRRSTSFCRHKWTSWLTSSHGWEWRKLQYIYCLWLCHCPGRPCRSGPRHSSCRRSSDHSGHCSGSFGSCRSSCHHSRVALVAPAPHHCSSHPGSLYFVLNLILAGPPPFSNLWHATNWGYFEVLVTSGVTEFYLCRYLWSCLQTDRQSVSYYIDDTF